MSDIFTICMDIDIFDYYKNNKFNKIILFIENTFNPISCNIYNIKYNSKKENTNLTLYDSKIIMNL